MKKLNAILVAVTLIVLAGVVQAGTITITASTTFLNYNATGTPADVATDSVGYLISSLTGYVPGDILTLSSSGTACLGSPCVLVTPTFVGILSSTGGGLTAAPVGSPYNRVPGALGTSGLPDFASAPTYYGGLVTINPNDFQITSGGVAPTYVGADTLYVGISDSYYADNSAGQGTPLTVTYSFTAPSVPEPGTVGLMLTGLAGLLAFGRKRFVRS